MEGGDIVESPRKRIKTDNALSTTETVVSSDRAHTEPAPSNETEDAQLSKELEVGITQFVSSQNVGFSGIFKKRYTDFLVNEILPSGEVLHLKSIAAPPSKDDKSASAPTEQPDKTQSKPDETMKDDANKDEAKEPEFQLSDEDRTLLESYFGPSNTKKIVTLHKNALSQPRRRPADFGKVPTTAISDRDHRIQIHQAIRRIFSSQLESSTDNEGVMVISVAPNRNNRNDGNQERGQRGNRINWDELGGSYLHFTIYKENKDTMETISWLSRQLKMNPKHFQFAGTKDRRGVTVQRASAQRLYADRLAKLNPTLWNAELGDFEYCPQGLDLGDLNGNEFVITLRECEIPGVDLKDPENAVKKTTEIVGSALRDLRERGYFNYYGLQRFGTFATRTDNVGVKMLQGDFKAACEAILHFSPHVLAAAQAGEQSTTKISSDDKARAEAIHIFQTTDRVNDALAKMPRKFAAEDRIIRHLGRARNDYLGALQVIPRNLRLMYVHAYQSLVWNYAAGERWRLYGDKVVEGDLVIVHEHRDKEVKGEKETEDIVDADGEVVVLPKAEDSAHSSEDMFTRARALTAEEASSGKYSIFDIVLPLPGFDVLYPANQMTDFYKNFMGSEQGGGLDPFDMRRKWKDLSLSGSYRKLLSRMGPDYSFEVKLYSDEDQKFVQTDVEVVRGETKEETPQEGDKLAVILKFQLGTSQYATMALRELMRGNAKTYVPDFSGGR
ncbi:pseudouridine synthase [Aspergillus sclerotialis]|uniref:Pseudouridine synthase n=1 Tax=Aspergillus sclerotialis TaxID=2070753 RepID=A0A3A2ZK65_9EURO|nr:pseudouridine synthase [Aspergillus sclerotialis]